MNLLLAVCPSPASTAESTFPIPPLPSYSIHEQSDQAQKVFACWVEEIFSELHPIVVSKTDSFPMALHWILFPVGS